MSNKHRVFCGISSPVIIIIFLVGYLLAQDKQKEQIPLSKKEEMPDKQAKENLIRGLEKDILEDAKSLDRYEKAMALGWLGKTLSLYKPADSLDYFQKAVEIVEDKSGAYSEQNDEKKLRLLTSRKLIELIENLSPPLEKRLKAILADYDKDNESVSIKQILAAIERKDRGQALSLWNEGFTRGYKSYQFISLILSFRHFNDNTADILFSKALKIASQISDISFHQGLAFIVFPELESPVLKKIPIPPDDLQVAYLNILSTFLFKGDSESNRCLYSSIAVSLLDVYKKLDPGKVGQIQIFSQQCKSHIQRADDDNSTISSEAEATSDQLIAKARKTKNKKSRFSYFMKAAVKARQEGNIENAINILDSIEDKDDDDGVWSILRRDYAGDSAIEKLKNKDISNFYKVINDCPEHLVFLVKIRSIRYLLQNNKSLAISIFQTLAKSIDASPAKEHISAYLTALDLSMDLLPSDSINIFDTLIVKLNDSNEKIAQPFSLSNSFVKPNMGLAYGKMRDIISAMPRLYARLGLLNAIISEQPYFK